MTTTPENCEVVLAAANPTRRKAWDDYPFALACKVSGCQIHGIEMRLVGCNVIVQPNRRNQTAPGCPHEMTVSEMQPQVPPRLPPG